MKKIELMYVDEDTPNIPEGEAHFVKIDDVGEKLNLIAYESGPNFTFETKEYGQCQGLTNPFRIFHDGYFKVRVPQNNEQGYTDIYCTNERIIATLQDIVNKVSRDVKGTGEFQILGEEDANKIYEEEKIPRYTLI